MFSESEIKNEIDKYLAGKQSFEDFEDWLVERSHARYLDNLPEIRKKIGEIRYLIFQFLEGEFNEDILKSRLRNIVNLSEKCVVYEQWEQLIRRRFATADENHTAIWVLERAPLSVEYA